MKTKLLIFTLLLITTILTTGCTNINTTKDIVEIANPASVYCEENGGMLELIFDNGESYGICNFDNGNHCEEWEYYRGECSPTLQKSGAGNNNLVCLPDTQECPDGSFVTRTGSECNFETCATTSKTQQELDNEDSISKIFDKYKNSNSQNTTGLTQEDIALMEELIEKLK